jgi:hypothetical protein
MCGATSAQTQLQNEQMETLQQYDAMMQQQYADQTALYSEVNSVLQPILKAGPNQEGFSSAEKQDLDSQAVEGTAENYQQAAKAVNEQLAAEGGGDAPITTGGQAQLKEQVAEGAAQSESQQESQIKQADYAQGYSEFQNAEEGEMAIAAGENPLGYMSATTNQGEAAANTANQIAQEDNSWISAALGAAGSIGGGLASDFEFRPGGG